MSDEYLRLKWGTLKGWKVESEACRDAIRRYFEDPASASCMMQHDTPKQRQALLDLIDAIDGPITSDWSGEDMTKEEAKKYILEYRT
jgi:hypothetical protein